MWNPHIRSKETDGGRGRESAPQKTYKDVCPGYKNCQNKKATC